MNFPDGLEDTHSDAVLTQRQSAVLERALELIVEGGEKALTTSRLARAASCSKESLYKWFGNREGLIEAMVVFQASKVRTSSRGGTHLTAARLHDQIHIFAQDLLEVLSGEISLTLNRMAVRQSTKEGLQLSKLLLDTDRGHIARRAMSLIAAGKAAGLLRYPAGEEAYQMLYGLIVSDLHIRMLLGGPPPDDTTNQAERAVAAFFRLFGTQHLLQELRTI